MLKKSGPAHVRQGTETIMCTTSTAVLRAVSYMFSETRFSYGSYSLALTAHICIWKIWIFAEEYALWHLDDSSNQWIRINLFYLKVLLHRNPVYFQLCILLLQKC